MIYYFIPGQSKPSRKQLSELKLGYAFDDESFVSVAVKAKSGPDGQDGFVVHPTDSPSYVPDKQSWFSHATPGVHFGWWNDLKPTPSSLIRNNKIDGNLVKLADGNEWEIPVARRWSIGTRDQEGKILWDEDSLTRRLEFKDGDWVEGEVINEQVLFCQVGRAIFDHWVEHMQDSPFTLPNNETHLCSDVLAMNYRLSSFEIGALGLLTSSPELLWSVLKQVIDVSGWGEMVKKKEAASQSSNAG